MKTTMDFPINVKVNYNGKTESFLVSDSERTPWECVEGRVKISFGLNNVQVKYFDEENEEVSINSQEEYEEAIKSAVKLGNQLHMNAYEIKGPVARRVCESGTVKRDFEVLKTGKKAIQNYSLLAKADGHKMMPTQDKEMTMRNDIQLNKDDQQNPPLWFTTYMETFKDQVVKEAVEKICHEFTERFSIQPLQQGSSNEPAGVGIEVPEMSSISANASDWLIVCSSCQNKITGICYQCSVCPSCTLCELCESCNYEHDPAHSLIKFSTLFSTPAPNHLSGNRLPAAGDHARLQKRIDNSIRKAEKQRLQAEKRRLKTEVKEIKEQLKMYRQGLHWNDWNDAVSDTTVLESMGTKPSTRMSPKLACNSIVPTMSAAFLDENLPDETCIQPGTKFIKHWTKNTGNVNCMLETKDLLSFELLDVNIVQGLERVPHNTPVDMTPCMSPLPHEEPLLEKPGLCQIEEETEGSGLKALLDVTLGKKNTESPPVVEDGEEDISGTQFVCETVIRSLTLEEAPDHKPPRWSKPGSPKTSLQGEQNVFFSNDRNETSGKTSLLSTDVERKKPNEQTQPEESMEAVVESFCLDQVLDKDVEGQKQQDDNKDEVQSQGSSTSSEGYIIILPDCFDTSRPLGESMYSSTLSPPEIDAGIETDTELECWTTEGKEQVPMHPGINDMLCTSQTLDTVTLTPEVVSCPTPTRTQREDICPQKTEHAIREMPINEVYQPRQNSIEGTTEV
ncbi:NBR1 autophagy cargo receptor a isoform X2 [Polyodon spathula]|uniref:NBR1 autophagy cargo receptor a isoform X2 n=1 Tax=Polyodon spathula TaxID=7913 RepID=UPI001B7DBBE6|nr:NBR1 autophagy cargo receptor a isoform X2 [Polyodon spathula]